MGSLDDAQRCIDSAQELARALQAQARLYADRGDWHAAYEQHIEFHVKSTLLHSAEQEARVEAIQASYDADERHRDTVRFRELAMRDALTGLYNRRFIDEQLKSVTAQTASARTPLSAAIADADFFKRINDECSHDVGDQVLRTMSALLAGVVVTPETVGRLDGEEFVILMPNVSAIEAVARCEEIRITIAGYDWTTLVGAIPVTISIGVATAADGQTSPAAILSDADRNLYAAKRSGRNKVVSDLD
ncbi:MAG: GGDEF domain-containing protein [Nakamurella sp.]